MMMYVVRNKETKEFITAQSYEPSLPENLFWELDENFEWPKIEHSEEEIAEFQLKQLRAKRDSLLKDCDWTQLPDALPTKERQRWASYRAELRNLTKDFVSLEAVVWPTKPV